ncbi:MAG: hypothetical protein ACHWZW_03945 [Spirulina sp.]
MASINIVLDAVMQEIEQTPAEYLLVPMGLAMAVRFRFQSPPLRALLIP